MAAWLIYIRERFPLPTYLLLVASIAASGASLFGSMADKSAWNWTLTLTGLLLFFFELRLMDELKDHAKDVIAHPRRPLPRGLLSTRSVSAMIGRLFVAMLIWSGVLVTAGKSGAGLLYLGITIYLGLMYREFFLGSWLGARSFLYGVTHQIILIPLVAYPAALFYPEGWLSATTLQLGVASLGGFFTYELCRKLDPDAHSVLRTYPQVYGRPGTLLRILLTASVGVLGATLLGTDRIVAPMASLTVLFSVAWLFRPRLHRWVEAVASIGLLVHLACLPLSRWLFGG